MFIDIFLLVLVVALGALAWRFSMEALRLRSRYKSIVDIDAAVALSKAQLEEVRHAREEGDAAAARQRAEQELQHQQRLSAQTAAAQLDVEKMRRAREEEDTAAARERAEQERQHQQRLSDQTAAANHALEQVRREHEIFLAQDQARRTELNEEYESPRTRYEQLKRELALVEENVNDISFGLYEPHFTFQDPDECKTALIALRARERDLIATGRAATCPISWRVGDSEREGARMVKQNTKLMLRAFNGECEGARADVSWNNITKMEERIKKSYEAVNNLSGVLKVAITPEFLGLKVDELRLTHEYERKRYTDREEQRRIREEIREEERARREAEKAEQDAADEEQRYQKLLAKAREEAAQATGARIEKLSHQVAAFEAKLDEARRKKERAISRAQLTRSGFVYVISNIGSFGNRVYKIGMTRRMEPMERIAELGDASVPFPFDLHAMLYSDNAPELENGLHQLLAGRRLNLVNPRREFYHDVELDEIEAYVREKGLSAQFVREPEAREYRETVAKRQVVRSAVRPQFCGDLFENAARAGAGPGA